MMVHPAERSNIVVKDCHNRYLAIHVCSFRLAVAPPLWGRPASMVMRVSQACVENHDGRMSPVLRRRPRHCGNRHNPEGTVKINPIILVVMVRARL